MRKKIALITTVAVLGVAAVGGTLAYFNAETDQLTNVFVADSGFEDNDDVLIDLLENFNGTTGINAEGLTSTDLTKIEHILPNQEIQKEPWVENNSDISAYIAVKISFEVGGEASSIADFAAYAELLGMDDTNWTFEQSDDDMYYIAYYNHEVPAGGETSLLFTDVKVAQDLTDDTMQNFNVILKAYAVQSAYNDDAVGATEADQAKAAIDAQWGF